VHFIGIGGIGISAIARMFLAQGKKVSGSDNAEGKVVEELRKVGAQIVIGQKKENMPKVSTEFNKFVHRFFQIINYRSG
jgi:UDP-N-acetylmuramate--alanine ligase